MITHTPVTKDIGVVSFNAHNKHADVLTCIRNNPARINVIDAND